MKNQVILVQGKEIAFYSDKKTDYISLTDIAKYRNSGEPYAIINNWMRNRATIEFLGLWEKLSNPDFKPLEFERFKTQAGSNYFVLSPQNWIESTNAIGVIAKSGRYGGTFAHKDIAFEFASWISSEFKLYLIIEFQRLKADENIRDYAQLEQLVVLSNLESINSVLIHQELNQSQRLEQLNKIAILQMKSLVENNTIKQLRKING